ncbi:hypothetical protein EDM59_29855 [Brevibacillus nitrificans]|uniref:Uncharacterized protein n=1 Tax=Brevibacillus nitrificans TaxID=651560 RepID=A0A3M8CU25_9BACL|nr:hypothetical protein EDM59_29855 [Brevibacillus nitrificans]
MIKSWLVRNSKDVTANDNNEFQTLLNDNSVSEVFVGAELNGAFTVNRAVIITGLNNVGGKFPINKLTVVNPTLTVEINNVNVTDLVTGQLPD